MLYNRLKSYLVQDQKIKKLGSSGEVLIQIYIEPHLINPMGETDCREFLFFNLSFNFTAIVILLVYILQFASNLKLIIRFA